MPKYKCPNCGFGIDIYEEWERFVEQMDKCPGCGNKLHFFTCTECGEHEILIEEIIITQTGYTNYLPCTCENENEHAAICEAIDNDGWIKINELNEDHRPGPDVTYDYEPFMADRLEEILTDLSAEARHEENSEIFCEKCYDDATEENWNREENEDLGDKSESEYYLFCPNCGHEIEFGWSHPGGGRIWPVECIDFNPWKTPPEPRYEENWRKKGWLRE